MCFFVINLYEDGGNFVRLKRDYMKKQVTLSIKTMNAKERLAIYNADMKSNFDELFSGVNTHTGTSYQLAATDANMYIRLSNANAIGLTVPSDSTASFGIGASVTVEQSGLGVVTASGADGVTVNGDAKTAGQFKIIVLVKTSDNTWTVIGGTV